MKTTFTFDSDDPLDVARVKAWEVYLEHGPLPEDEPVAQVMTEPPRRLWWVECNAPSQVSKVLPGMAALDDTVADAVIISTDLPDDSQFDRKRLVDIYGTGSAIMDEAQIPVIGGVKGHGTGVAVLDTLAHADGWKRLADAHDTIAEITGIPIVMLEMEGMLRATVYEHPLGPADMAPVKQAMGAMGEREVIWYPAGPSPYATVDNIVGRGLNSWMCTSQQAYMNAGTQGYDNVRRIAGIVGGQRVINMVYPASSTHPTFWPVPDCRDVAELWGHYCVYPHQGPFEEVVQAWKA